MAKYTVHIDERTKKGRLALSYLKENNLIQEEYNGVLSKKIRDRIDNYNPKNAIRLKGKKQVRNFFKEVWN